MSLLASLTSAPAIKDAHIKALEKAKIALMTKPDSVFFCEMAFSFKYKWTDTVPTAATDGKSIFINPEFFMRWNREQQLGLILHETLHPVYMHSTRRGNRDPKLWNYAADYVINLVIVDRGFKLPDGGLYDERFRGMTTEQVYDILIAEAKKNPQAPQPGKPSNQPGSSGQGGDDDTVPGMGNDIMDAPGSPEEAQELEDSIQQTLVRAAIRSKEANDKPGTIPGDLQIFLDRLLKPKLPWNKLLLKYFAQFNKSDYSFKRPNRRFFPDHFLPSLYSTTLMNIAVAVDTSGSVSDDEFHRFISEFAGILRMCKPEKMTLIQFDTQLKDISDISDLRELMKVKFTGRGGTEIGPLVEWTENNKPQLLLVFTDGEFHFKNYSTKRNVLWMIHNNKKFKPQFGKAIHYDIA